MTWEEAERMMTFIREQQARFNATRARINERLNRPPAKIDRTIDRTVERAWALLATAKHAREIRKFDERLNALLHIVKSHTSRNDKV